MAPIDYFMGLFVGVCVGLAGLAYVNAATPGVPGCHIGDLVACRWALLAGRLMAAYRLAAALAV